MGILDEVCIPITLSYTHGSHHSRPKLEAFADKTANAPLLGLFSALMKDWIPLIDEYYYCAPSRSIYHNIRLTSHFLNRHCSLACSRLGHLRIVHVIFMFACYLLSPSLLGPLVALEIARGTRRSGCEVIHNFDRGQSGRPLFHRVVDFVW